MNGNGNGTRPAPILRSYGPNVSQAQIAGLSRDGTYRIYNVQQAVTATGTASAQIILGAAVYIWCLSGSATAGGTAQIGHVDAFRFQVSRTGSGDKLMTAQISGAAAFERWSGYWYLKRPWQAQAGEVLQIDFTGIATGNFTADIALHTTERQG